MNAEIVVATTNAHKVDEIRAILSRFVARECDLSDSAAYQLVTDVVVSAAEVGPLPEVVEDEISFAGNALLKARSANLATGLAALADDSGLCVDALGGSPGVFSARWAGKNASDENNRRLLLEQLSDVPPRFRSAHFRCSIALVDHTGREWTRDGVMAGHVGESEVGDGGFGYDPIVIPDGQHRTVAQLSPAEKDAISHRGHAVSAIAPQVLPIVMKALKA